MSMRSRLADRLERADIRIDGARMWDLQIKDDRFFGRIRHEGSIGLGESYVDGWWECKRLDELAHRVFSTGIVGSYGTDHATRVLRLKSKIFNLQRGQRSTKVARIHYDLGNTFFERMLGPTMVYSCAHWSQASTLDGAQEHKLELLCRRLGVKTGHRVLDVGCGWGGFARHAATRHGCHVVGITNSSKQLDYAQVFCKGIPVEVHLMDYRDPRLSALGPFDRVVSVGMFEHVGGKNYGRYMEIIRRLLADDGRFLLQTIGTHGPCTVDPWIDRHIFPNSAVPRPMDILHAIDGRFLIQEWWNAGRDYDPTLMAWHENLCSGAEGLEPWNESRFRRKWSYYLLTAAGNFRSETTFQLWRILLTP